MTNRFLISVAAAALIAGTGFANAQGAGTSREAPSAGAATQSAPSSERGGAASGTMNHDSGSATGMKGSKFRHEGDGIREGATWREQERAGHKVARSEVEEHELRERDQGRQGHEGRRPRQKGTTAQSREGQTGNMNAQTKGTADSKSGTAESKSQTTGNAATSATAAPPAEKRTQIVSAIKSEKIQETTNVNFNISVGAVMPATVRFHPLPAADRRDLSGMARLRRHPGARPLHHRAPADA